MESTSNWREQIADDNNFKQKVPYDVDNVILTFEKLTSDLDRMNPYLYCSVMYEFTKAFGNLSSALSMGFADITEKVGIWRNLFKTHTEDEVTDLQTLMEKELKYGLEKCNGDNNSKVGHKKGTTYYKYVSGCRTLVRLTWFLHFLTKTLQNMLDTKDGFDKCIKGAYTEVLAPHHPWLVRTSVGVALGFASSKRNGAYKAFFGKYKLLFLRRIFF
jgi:hypothetical protein